MLITYATCALELTLCLSWKEYMLCFTLNPNSSSAEAQCIVQVGQRFICCSLEAETLDPPAWHASGAWAWPKQGSASRLTRKT